MLVMQYYHIQGLRLRHHTPRQVVDLEFLVGQPGFCRNHLAHHLAKAPIRARLKRRVYSQSNTARGARQLAFVGLWLQVPVGAARKCTQLAQVTLTRWVEVLQVIAYKHIVEAFGMRERAAIALLPADRSAKERTSGCGSPALVRAGA